MKYAVIADIHGNSLALKAVLEDIHSRSIERAINLGDTLYGPLDPAGTYDLIRKNDIISISGNEDRELIDGYDNPTIRYTLSQLPPEALIWLQNIPFNIILDDIFYCCHANPVNDNEYLLEKVIPDEVVLRPENEISLKMS